MMAVSRPAAPRRARPSLVETVCQLCRHCSPPPPGSPGARINITRAMSQARRLVTSSREVSAHVRVDAGGLRVQALESTCRRVASRVERFDTISILIYYELTPLVIGLFTDEVIDTSLPLYVY